MKKIPAVSQVRVSLDDGLTILDLKPGNTTTLAELRQVIKRKRFCLEGGCSDCARTRRL